MNIFKIILFISLSFSASTIFTACNEASEENTQGSVPIIRDFVVNIDEGTSSGVSLGTVVIENEGGSTIDSFRLEGRGYSNFSISNRGEIFTNVNDFNSTTTSKYDLTVIARNSYGDSDVATVTIQVSNLSQPVINDLTLQTEDYYSGTIATIDILKFIRDGISGTPIMTNIKSFELEDNLDGRLSVSNDIYDFGAIIINSPLGSSPSSYDIYVRAININDEVGPYAKLTININNTGYVDYTDTTDTTYTDPTSTNDYIGNDIYSANYISINSNGYYGTLEYFGDRDVYSFDIFSDTTITVYTDSNIDTVGWLYDTGYNQLMYDDDGAGNGNNFGFTYFLTPGTYYIDVGGYGDNTIGDYTLFLTSSVQDNARFSRTGEIVYDNNYNLSWQDDYWAQNTMKPWLTQANYDACIADPASAACEDTSGDTAASYCTDLLLDGYSDWRLPSESELASIVESANYPTVDSTFINTMDSSYWTSSSDAANNFAFMIDFSNNGWSYVDQKNYYQYVRCVRDGF